MTTERGFKFIEPAPNRHFSIIGKVWGRGNLFEMIFWCNLSNYTEEEEKWIKDWLFKVECSSMPCTGWRHTPRHTPDTPTPAPPTLQLSVVFVRSSSHLNNVVFIRFLFFPNRRLADFPVSITFSFRQIKTFLPIILQYYLTRFQLGWVLLIFSWGGTQQIKFFPLLQTGQVYVRIFFTENMRIKLKMSSIKISSLKLRRNNHFCNGSCG